MGRGVVEPFRNGALWEKVDYWGWEELVVSSLALFLGSVTM